MKKTARILGIALLVSLVAGFCQSCATLGQIGEAFTNLKRLKFRLAGVSGFRLAGISIGRKSRLSDFSVVDAARLFSAFRARRLPAGFVLDVEAVNPNDGTGGSRRTVSTLTSFDWRLLIDGRTTIAGNIEEPIEIPGTGQTAVIPLAMEIDLYEFFGERGYNDVVDLALALGGVRNDISRISLDARPRVSTPFGEIAYPGRITIVDREFR